MKKWKVTLVDGNNYQTGMYNLSVTGVEDKQDAIERAKSTIAQCGYFFGNLTFEQKRDRLNVVSVEEESDQPEQGQNTSKVTVYNKLVRDKIPLKIELNGAKAKYHRLSPEEFREAIKTKLLEEVNELLSATTKDEMIEELADIEEVLEWIRTSEHIGEYEVDSRQHLKYIQNGGFYDRFFLESVEEN